MSRLSPSRRSLLVALGAAAASMPLASIASNLPSVTDSHVFNADKAEHLIHFRDGGNIFIMAGTDSVAMGTQQIKAQGGIPIHRHLHMEEAFYVLDGSGTCILEDAQHPVSQGSSILVARNTWHGFKTASADLLVLWVMAPGGLDAFFRETCSAPGAPAKKLRAEQVRQIALKYGTEFK
jgi:quercetin dioxygenase-like cupin family protein